MERKGNWIVRLDDVFIAIWKTWYNNCRWSQPSQYLATPYITVKKNSEEMMPTDEMDKKKIQGLVILLLQQCYFPKPK